MADVYRNFSFTRLAAACGAADTTLTVDDVSLLPTGVDLAAGDFRMAFDSPLEYQNTFEIVRVTAIDATAGTLTVERGQEGTTAVAHGVDALLKGTLTASMLTTLREAADAVSAPYHPSAGYRGDYDAATAYAPGQTVVYERALWEALESSTGVAPGAPATPVRYVGGPQYGATTAPAPLAQQFTPTVSGVLAQVRTNASASGSRRIGFTSEKPTDVANIPWLGYADVTGNEVSDLSAPVTITAGTPLWMVSTESILVAPDGVPSNATIEGDIYYGDTFATVLTGYVMPIQGVEVALPWDKALDFPSVPETRSTAALTTPSLDAGAQHVGSISMAKGYRLYSIETDVPARVRLYATSAQRDADAARAVGVDPTGDHGLVLEYVTTAEQLSGSLSPLVDGANLEASPAGDIPILVANQSGAATPVTVTLMYLRTE